MNLDDLEKPSIERKVHNFADMVSLQKAIAEDFALFLSYACRYHGFKLSRMQGRIAKELQAGHGVILLNCFRGASKSFIIDCYCAWRWHRCINTKILILSGREEQAKKHSRQIRKIIKLLPALNYLNDYTKITESGFQFRSASVEADLSLNCAGIFANIEGSRADVVINDDVETKKTSATKDLRKKLISRLSEVSHILHPPHRFSTDTKEATCAIFIGTYQSEDSVYRCENETNHPLAGAHTIRIPCFNKFGHSVFPERFTTEQLHFKRERTSTVEWALQMLLDPSLISKAERVLKIDSLIVCDAESFDNVMTIDPAGDSSKSANSDEHAICIGGRRRDDSKLVHIQYLNGYRNVSGADICKLALGLVRKYNVQKIIIETNFSAYLSLYQSEASRLGLNVKIESVRSSVNKRTRLIETLEVPINSNRVSFSRNILSDAETLDQFKNFTFGDLPANDDRLDALSLNLNYWQTTKIFAYNDKWQWDSVNLDRS